MAGFVEYETCPQVGVKLQSGFQGAPVQRGSVLPSLSVVNFFGVAWDRVVAREHVTGYHQPLSIFPFYVGSRFYHLYNS